MPMIKKSITLTDQQNEWLQSQIRKGLYASDSEVLRELIREKQEADLEELRMSTVRNLLLEGEESGIGKHSPQEIKEAVLSRHATKDA